MNYQWDFGGLLPYTRAFAWGVVVTIELTLLSSAIGSLCGVPLAVALRGSPLVARPLAFLIDVIRAVPTLVLIFFFYYFPYLDVFGISPPSGFTAVLLTLVIAQACYTADLIRAAIDQVSRAGPRGRGHRLQASPGRPVRRRSLRRPTGPAGAHCPLDREPEAVEPRVGHRCRGRGLRGEDRHVAELPVAGGLDGRRRHLRRPGPPDDLWASRAGAVQLDQTAMKAGLSVENLGSPTGATRC